MSLSESAGVIGLLVTEVCDLSGQSHTRCRVRHDQIYVQRRENLLGRHSFHGATLRMLLGRLYQRPVDRAARLCPLGLVVYIGVRRNVAETGHVEDIWSPDHTGTASTSHTVMPDMY